MIVGNTDVNTRFLEYNHRSGDNASEQMNVEMANIYGLILRLPATQIKVHFASWDCVQQPRDDVGSSYDTSKQEYHLRIAVVAVCTI